MTYELTLARVMKGVSKLDLRGRTLIFAGASRGIGRALASELAQKGVNLVLNARSEALLRSIERGMDLHAPPQHSRRRMERTKNTNKNNLRNEIKLYPNQPTQSIMAKPAIADATIHSTRQNKIIRDKPETKGFILS